jgi:hypothetical protein
MAVAHRIRQGIRALLAFSQPVDTDLARRYLSPRELALFAKMSRSEQLHSLNVLHDVLSQGSAPDALAIAALLHDVGKARYPLFTWQKTFAVLVHAVAPGLFGRWGKGNPRNVWLRPFVVLTQHPMWSAETLTDAGTIEAAVWLVAHHQDSAEIWVDHPYFSMLERLQAADRVN